MKIIRALQRVAVTPDGHGVVSHAGAALLVKVADESGLTTSLSRELLAEGTKWRLYDLGRVMTQLATSVADGGDCISDLSVLRNQPELFGEVPSTSTAWRVIDSLHSGSFRAIATARFQARSKVWARGAAPKRIVLDFDATLITAHSDKEDAKPNYKKGFGFHPLLCVLDETREILAGKLRPGNAGSNTADDHLEVLDDAIAQLPPGYWPDLVRADSAGATHAFLDGLRERKIPFSVGFDIDAKVRAALELVQEEDWQPSVDQEGSVRDGSWIVEITDLMDLDTWPEGSRVIARRERPHPGAQLSLFDQVNGFRHQATITDQPGDIVTLEAGQRGHARVEDAIRCGKDTGLRNFPCGDIVRNMAWLQIVLLAIDLLAWTQRLGFDGELQKAEPKRFRQFVLHVAARITRSARRTRLRIQQDWPYAPAIAQAFNRIDAAFLT